MILELAKELKAASSRGKCCKTLYREFQGKEAAGEAACVAKFPTKRSTKEEQVYSMWFKEPPCPGLLETNFWVSTSIKLTLNQPYRSFQKGKRPSRSRSAWWQYFGKPFSAKSKRGLDQRKRRRIRLAVRRSVQARNLREIQEECWRRIC